MDTQLKRGLLEICVLSVLNRGDSYGYRMIEDMKDCMEITESTLYPILRRLEGAGLLGSYSVEYSGRLRKYYRILPPGMTRLAEFEGEWQEMTRIYRFISGGGTDE